MAGYVYLVWAKGTDMYKIGSSQYPEKRLPGLQTGSPVKLQLIASRAFDDYEYQEKRLHSFWEKFREQGEWFQFHPLVLPRVLDSLGVRDKWTHSLIEDAEIKASDIAFDMAQSAVLEAINDGTGLLRRYMDARNQCIFGAIEEALTDDQRRQVLALMTEKLESLPRKLELFERDMAEIQPQAEV